ncbi:LisH dimerisation motif [Plasmopara halstedii]|uniref:LisH dimerisation motif n=1 Tax=Plasmopara halstedii TaxID=4781 RepID=A0A0P1AJH2_PLAHL|nr:LisH dimerisation motif [Plasmopara halstedii]CEG41026.1 LisH dimerisation motif [Plasmopara halstedii]|eukprot:XP_024577395.1 LisH dimerisation motif [Plasmopara halstedii]
MDENKILRSLVRDGDGNPLMTLEEFKEGMFQSIRDNGTVELIRAQLRRRFIEKLQQQRNNQDRENETTCNIVSLTPDEKLVNGLIVEFLTTKGLENTLAVFVPEVGGSQNQVDSFTILQLLHITSEIQDRLKQEQDQTGQSLLLILLQELKRRFQLTTIDSGTQTAMDCIDHRLVLENELRRVEKIYFQECAAQKLEPQKSLEERMIQYQREYDAICTQRLEEEIERLKGNEIAFVRTEERKRFTRELDNLRAILLQESRTKQENLEKRQHDLELAFVARKTELETSLFEIRQTLFQDKEKLRVKEAELQVKMERDSRYFMNETERVKRWEESVRLHEENVESTIAQAIREKERVWNLERQHALNDLETQRNALTQREHALMIEMKSLKTLQDQVLSLQHQKTELETALLKTKDELQRTQHSTVRFHVDQQHYQEKMVELEKQLQEYKTKFNNVDMTNIRLIADATMTQKQVEHYKTKNVKRKEQLTAATCEIETLKQQILDIKLNEATGIVNERQKMMQIIDEERASSQWKIHELLMKSRELATRVAEAETLAEKYQTQYEDEKLQVDALRRDVSNLSTLLTQAQTAITLKHSGVRDVLSFRSNRQQESERWNRIRMMDSHATWSCII